MKQWQGIEEFVQVVKCGSFSAAALKLGISKSHVSQQISKLEENLSSRLLHRTTRKLNLTECGENFYPRCLQIIEDLNDAALSVNRTQEQIQGPLRISSPHLLGEIYLVPAIAEFVVKYPNIDIELDFSSKKIDLIQGHYDLAIQVGKREDVNVVNIPLSDTRFFVAASPNYLKENSLINVPQDIKNHQCLLFVGKGLSKPWRFKKEFDKTALKVNVSGHWRSNSGTALRAAAKEGLGLAYLPDYYLNKDVKENKLKLLLPEWSFNHRQIVAIYQNRNYPSAKIRLFTKFLSTFFQRDEYQLTNNI